jgi:hypothetical protein
MLELCKAEFSLTNNAVRNTIGFKSFDKNEAA